MTLRLMSYCRGCKHYAGYERCKAFPRGIPQPILDRIDDHRKPIEGDMGIQYERRADGMILNWEGEVSDTELDLFEDFK